MSYRNLYLCVFIFITDAFNSIKSSALLKGQWSYWSEFIRTSQCSSFPPVCCWLWQWSAVLAWPQLGPLISPLQSCSYSCSAGLIINIHRTRQPAGLWGWKAGGHCAQMLLVLRAALQQVTQRTRVLRQNAKAQKPTKCVLNELGSSTRSWAWGFKTDLKCVEMPNLYGCFARKQTEKQARKCQTAWY